MAQTPLRPCKQPGCIEVTRYGWCPKHKPKHKRKASADYHWLYSLPIWVDDLRPNQLLREPFCRACADEGMRVRATVVDHIIPHRGDLAVFTDKTNLQSLCKHHHDRKTALETMQRRR